MNNFYKFFLIIPFLILGCKSNVVKETLSIQKIDNLNMIIYSNIGEKIYSISSPNSSFDKEKNILSLKKTAINLFENKKKKYIIRSNAAKLFNNNRQLELIGNVQLRTFVDDNDTLSANSFFWNIENSEYILEGDVRFENESIMLSSTKATLNSNNIIEFFSPVKYVLKNDENVTSYEIESDNAFYNIESKSVSFESKDNRVRSKIYF